VYKNLGFLLLEAALFPRKLTSHFLFVKIFLTFVFYFMLDLYPSAVPEPQCIPVPAKVAVPVRSTTLLEIEPVFSLGQVNRWVSMTTAPPALKTAMISVEFKYQCQPGTN
jgi:hypothetical protein